MEYGFMTLKALLIDFNQFKKSKLQPAIMSVLKCSYTEAYDLGKTHCNLLSFWAILYCQELYQKDYSAFFRFCLDNELCNSKGKLLLDKPEMLEKLGIKAEVIKYDTIPEDLKPNQFFQIAINNKAHFMAGASGEDSNIYLFDTNDRKYGFELLEALEQKQDKITWIKRIG
jgi:hypothetical protein